MAEAEKFSPLRGAPPLWCRFPATALKYDPPRRAHTRVWGDEKWDFMENRGFLFLETFWHTNRTRAESGCWEDGTHGVTVNVGG